MIRYEGEEEGIRQFLDSEGQFQVSGFKTVLEEGEVPEIRTQEEEQFCGQRITLDLKMAMFQASGGGEVWNSGCSLG